MQFIRVLLYLYVTFSTASQLNLCSCVTCLYQKKRFVMSKTHEAVYTYPMLPGHQVCKYRLQYRPTVYRTFNTVVKPVVKPVWQPVWQPVGCLFTRYPVWQPVVSCKRGFTDTLKRLQRILSHVILLGVFHLHDNEHHVTKLSCRRFQQDAKG